MYRSVQISFKVSATVKNETPFLKLLMLEIFLEIFFQKFQAISKKDFHLQAVADNLKKDNFNCALIRTPQLGQKSFRKECVYIGESRRTLT
jgi:hypothetical protein